MLITTYFWKPASEKYHAYTSDDVRLLERMISRHMTAPYEFAVITDTPELFKYDKNINAIPIDLTTNIDGTCYSRLMTFHPEGKKIFGERILQIDLDTIITGDMAHLIRDEDLILWHNPGRVPWDKPQMGQTRPYYNTSILMHKCGTMGWLYEDFKKNLENQPTHNRRYKDDQWYLSGLLGPGVPFYDAKDGVYRLGRSDTPGSGVDGVLPENACVVTFPGSEGKPWEPEIAKKNTWIKHHRQWGIRT